VEERKTNWGQIAADPKFQELHHRKVRFLFGWWIFSTLLYIVFLAGAGLAQKFYAVRVIGDINVAYWLVIIMMFYCFVISVYYASWANKVSDKLTSKLVEEFKGGGVDVDKLTTGVTGEFQRGGQK